MKIDFEMFVKWKGFNTSLIHPELIELANEYAKEVSEEAYTNGYKDAQIQIENEKS